MTDSFKEIVVEQLLVAHIYRQEHETNPILALNDLIDYHMSIALDPVVSKPVRDLMVKVFESYLDEAEGDIDYVRFLIDRNLK